MLYAFKILLDESFIILLDIMQDWSIYKGLINSNLNYLDGDFGELFKLYLSF